MSSLPLPTELLLAIFNEVINTHTQTLLLSAEDAMYTSDPTQQIKIRTQRLASFRCLARVCKTWLDPARTVFWTEVVLFSLLELIDFAGAIHRSESKPACIRTLYFSICTRRHTNAVAVEVRRCFPDALRRLPPHLHMLGVDTYDQYSSVIYDILTAAHNDHPSWVIDVHKLFIGYRPNRRDIFSFFAFTRNVVHLVLRISDLDGYDLSGSPCISMELESVVIKIEFDWSPHILDAVHSLTRVLGPACTTLQSLTIELFYPDFMEKLARAEMIKHILSLNNSTLSTLSLRVMLSYHFQSDINELTKQLTDAGAFTSFTALQNLELGGVGIYPDMFRQMGCSALQRLEVTVMEGHRAVKPPVRDGKEAMSNTLESLALVELAKLERLTIKFANIAVYGAWSGTRDTWGSIEEECTKRKIECIVEHPIQRSRCDI